MLVTKLDVTFIDEHIVGLRPGIKTHKTGSERTIQFIDSMGNSVTLDEHTLKRGIAVIDKEREIREKHEIP